MQLQEQGEGTNRKEFRYTQVHAPVHTPRFFCRDRGRLGRIFRGRDARAPRKLNGYKFTALGETSLNLVY